MAIEKSFRESKEIIIASEHLEKFWKSYDMLIITFQSRVLEELLNQKLIEEIDNLKFGTTHGKYAVYKLISHPEILFYLSPVGAPTTVAILEEITYVFSIKHIVLYGSAGVLLKDVTTGKVIVPTKAYRDEGTSYHYQPASDFIDIAEAHKVSKILRHGHIEYVEGYTWTTDAFYRETQAIFNERKSQGCICVEMEISAVQAFCYRRFIKFYPFVYGADNLDSKKWDKRILGNLDVSRRVSYFLLAFNVAKSILEEEVKS